MSCARTPRAIGGLLVRFSPPDQRYARSYTKVVLCQWRL